MTLLLLLLLAARVLTVPRPAEGVNRLVIVAVVALALFATWMLVSSRWSHDGSRALIDFDRALLYVASLAVFGSIALSPRRLQWMVRGIALAAFFVCAVALVTRVLPDLWPIAEQSTRPRLSYPVSYHNALGLMAAIGITLCVGLTCNERESALVRVLAAAAVPVMAATLVLTLSRGGFATAALGVIVFVVVAHPRGLLGGLVAAGPATAIAISSAYGADLLVSLDPLSTAAQEQGKDVATVVALCAVGAGLLRALMLYVDDVLVALRPTRQLRRRLLLGGATAFVMGAAALSVALDAPQKYDEFLSGGVDRAPGAAGPLSERLTSVNDNGRVAYWRVAIDTFERDPVHGTGAGTYPNAWDRERPLPEGASDPDFVGTIDVPLGVRDAHSLYAEVLAELGVVGFVLVVIALLTILVGVARRIRGSRRVLYATIFAALVAWIVAAGFDWHWEMPAVTMWFFALGGAAIAAAPRPPATRFLGMLPRTVIALACGALLVFAPLRLLISDAALGSARDAYRANNCDDVSGYAQQSLSALSNRPEPREFLAACQLRNGQTVEAIAELRSAARHAPDNWRVYYSLAVAQAVAGKDPRPALRRAAELNPVEPVVVAGAANLGGARDAGERRRAVKALDLKVLIPPL